MADQPKVARPVRSTAQIEADLDAARERLSGNVADLIDRIHPTRIKEREIDRLKGLATDQVDQVRAQVINPDGSPRVGRLLAIGGAVAGFVAFVAVLRALGRRARGGRG